MKILTLFTAINLTAFSLLLNPAVPPDNLTIGEGSPVQVAEEKPLDDRVEKVRSYLERKKSPLSDHSEQIVSKKHWKLIIAVSAIESSYCKRKIAFNCWGIMKGSGGLRRYESYEEAIDDVDALFERRQSQGRWLTVEAMNCSYVVPCNPNWVSVVNSVLKDLDELIPNT